MAVIFVGDKPSKKNLNQKIPFVGTKSYKTLLEWVAELDVDVNDMYLLNRENLKERQYSDGTFDIELPYIHASLYPGDAVIALGNKASEFLDKLRIHHFKLPHPSGLNRKINDKKWLKQELKKCKGYIHG